MSHLDFTTVATWTASLLSMAGVLSFLFSTSLEDSLVIKSNLGLPFYAAGISQWFLFGIATRNWALILPCAVQFIPLVILLRKYVQRRTS